MQKRTVIAPELHAVGDKHHIIVIREGEYDRGMSVSLMLSAIYESIYRLPIIPGIAMPHIDISKEEQDKEEIRVIPIRRSMQIIMKQSDDSRIRVKCGDIMIVERERVIHITKNMASIIAGLTINK